MEIRIAKTDEDLRRCYSVMVQLRQKLSEAEFVGQARRQAERDGYIVAFLEDQAQVRAVAGFRVSECLASGRFLYVDDLATDEAHRSRGFGEALFDWIVAQARNEGCAELTLDSGVQRHGAHRFYLRKRMQISSYHFRLEVPAPRTAP